MKKNICGIGFLAVVLIMVFAFTASTEYAAAGSGNFVLKSSAFPDKGKIPAKYGRQGNDLSPPLTWQNPPKGTKSYVLTVEDPDAPSGTFVHWVIFNIPGKLSGLPEGVPTEKELDNGAVQSRNDFGSYGYEGPDPPSGSHHYIFTLTALGVDKIKRPSRKILKEHTLGEATLTGMYP
jgi:Raf kinase inhibitor-like YbhB/YbcL family protein